MQCVCTAWTSIRVGTLARRSAFPGDIGRPWSQPDFATLPHLGGPAWGQRKFGFGAQHAAAASPWQMKLGCAQLQGPDCQPVQCGMRCRSPHQTKPNQSKPTLVTAACKQPLQWPWARVAPTKPRDMRASCMGSNRKPAPAQLHNHLGSFFFSTWRSGQQPSLVADWTALTRPRGEGASGRQGHALGCMLDRWRGRQRARVRVSLPGRLPADAAASSMRPTFRQGAHPTQVLAPAPQFDCHLPAVML